MQIGFVTASSEPSDWFRRLCATGRNVEQYPATAARWGTPDLWVIILENVQALHDGRMWLRSLNAPILLVTPHLAAAYALRTSIGNLSIICHPSRAAAFLEDMLMMTVSGAGGPAVFGPFQLHALDRTYRYSQGRDYATS